MGKMKQWLGFPLDKEYQEEIEKVLDKKTYRVYLIFGALIMLCQLIMIIVMSSRTGGPFAKPRRVMYFYSYMFLLSAAIILMVCKVLAHKKGKYRCSLRLNFVFFIIFCMWSTAVTLNDQLGGNGLNVFTYITLAVAVFGYLKLWQSLALFGSNFILLNCLLPYFPTPSGADQTFNNLMNSFFISLFAVALAALFYWNRIYAEYNHMIIQSQYKKIEEMNRKLNRQVLTDNLTGVFNRRYMDDNLETAFKKAKDAGGSSCMMIDIDYFKQYNDTYGHQAGDQCLIAIASMLMDTVKDMDANVIRYGGEEFLLFFFGTDTVRGRDTAEQLRIAVDEGRYTGKEKSDGHITVSIGIYQEYPLKGTSIEQFIYRADQALYMAKRKGRNCVVEYGALE